MKRIFIFHSTVKMEQTPVIGVQVQAATLSVEEPRYGAACASLGGGELLLFGGHSGDYCGDTIVLRPEELASRTLSLRRGSVPSPRRGHSLTGCTEGAYLFGGDCEGSSGADLWLFDKNNTEWTQIQPR